MAEASTDEQKLSPAEKAKLAAKKKAEAAKKAAPVSDPFVDNGDGSITDPNSGLTWKKTDAWLDKKLFYTWQDHQEYVDWVNQNKDQFGGYNNWRIPTKAESLTLFDKTGVKQLMDKNGTYYPIDSIFAPGGASNTWISECSDEKIIRMDLKIGLDTPYPNNDVWSSMRLVRKEGEAAAKSSAPVLKRRRLQPLMQELQKLRQQRLQKNHQGTLFLDLLPERIFLMQKNLPC